MAQTGYNLKLGRPLVSSIAACLFSLRLCMPRKSERCDRPAPEGLRCICMEYAHAQAEFPRLERPLVSSIAACLVQSRPLKCAPHPLKDAVPGLHPGFEAVLQGGPWEKRCFLQTAHEGAIWTCTQVSAELQGRGIEVRIAAHGQTRLQMPRKMAGPGPHLP